MPSSATGCPVPSAERSVCTYEARPLLLSLEEETWKLVPETAKDAASAPCAMTSARTPTAATAGSATALFCRRFALRAMCDPATALGASAAPCRVAVTHDLAHPYASGCAREVLNEPLRTKPQV